MKIASVTILLALTIGSAQASETAKETIKYQNMYKFMTDMASDMRTSSHSYFECDYTIQSCERGRSWTLASPFVNWRVFEIVNDADRTTVIGHGACSIRATTSLCWRFDDGFYTGVINGHRRDGIMTVEDHYDWPRPIW